MDKHLFLQAQRRILKLVAGEYPQVYLVGGTALNLLYRHRASEDLDFFTQHYSRKLHRDIAATIRRKTGYPFDLVEEETRKSYVAMAVYEFEIDKASVLKVDFVSDFVELLKPRSQDGTASVQDIYCRKILAAIGWTSGESRIGRKVAGGRQKTKDLFDIFYLSHRVQPLSEWFPQCFDREAYERLASWYLGLPKQKAAVELLELVPRCDPRAVFKHLDDEIIHKLNRKYF